MNLQIKIDFEVLVMVKNANPNGDPLNRNRPRETYDGFGEISDAYALSGKIRNRLQDMGENIFVQSDERSDDGCKSLAGPGEKQRNNAKSIEGKDKDLRARAACEKWIDAFGVLGQVFAF